MTGSGPSSGKVGPGHAAVVGLHSASFNVWLGEIAIQVLAYVLRLRRLVGAGLHRRTRVRGASLRAWTLATPPVVGATAAVWTLPFADAWQ